MKKQVLIYKLMIVIIIFSISCNKNDSKEEDITENQTNPPVANFVANQTDILVSNSVSFTDNTTNNPNTWVWDFGNGEYSTEKNPSVTYNAPGSYSVSLTVSNNYGTNSITKDDYIDVVISENIFVDPRDDNAYYTVTIGNQTWFAQNLNYDSSSSIVYNFDPANGDTHGRYYYITSSTTSLCPDGWHIPSDNEWGILETYLGIFGSTDTNFPEGFRGTDQGSRLAGNPGLWIAGNLKNHSQFGATGFFAVPSGYYNAAFDSFSYFGFDASFWTNTICPSTNTLYHRTITYSDTRIGRFAQGEFDDDRFCIRCIQD